MDNMNELEELISKCNRIKGQRDNILKAMQVLQEPDGDAKIEYIEFGIFKPGCGTFSAWVGDDDTISALMDELQQLLTDLYGVLKNTEINLEICFDTAVNRISKENEGQK